MYPNRQSGFTLIELMVVVAIVAIIAAVAYPSFNNYMMKARRADGRELLMRIGAAEEKFYTNNNRYATTLAEMGMTGNSEQLYYTVANPVVNATRQTYVLTATPVGRQAPDRCGGLTLNNLGVRGMTNALPAAETNGKCW